MASNHNPAATGMASRSSAALFLISLILGGALASPAGATEPTPSMHESVDARDWEGILSLVRGGADPNAMFRGLTLVRLAVREDEPEALAHLERLGARLEPMDFLYAAETGRLGIVRFFVERGFDTELADPYEMTPLILAALNGHREVCAYLLDQGADVEAREVVQGYNALILASAHGYPDIVEMLLAHGADPTLATRDGYTALSWAMERARPGSGHGRIIRLLNP